MTEGRVIEKGGGRKGMVLFCGHTSDIEPLVHGKHPTLGALYRCPRCKKVVPAKK